MFKLLCLNFYDFRYAAKICEKIFGFLNKCIWIANSFFMKRILVIGSQCISKQSAMTKTSVMTMTDIFQPNSSKSDQIKW